MFRVLKWVIALGLTLFFLMFFAQLLTSRTYMTLSQGRYTSHEEITYDHRFVAHKLIDYLNYRHDDLTFGATIEDDSVLMRDIEIRHMVDVKHLYTMLRLAALGALAIAFSALLVLWRKDPALMYQALRDSYRLPLVFTLVMGTIFITNFSRAFVLFHELFFDNDDWMLRSDDVLIQLLPELFWFVSALLILVGLVLAHGGLYVFAKRNLKKIEM